MPEPADRPPPPVPRRPSLRALRESAQACRACELWQGTTQAVVGVGRRDARLMLVGEQPGDREDVEGRPFVGPAGRILERGLQLADIARRDVFVTNVVKHFRYRARGRRRIHQRPERVHVAACRPWLDAELALIRPDAVVCLGATAAQGLLGPDVRVKRDRGRPIESELAEHVSLTIHPSAILRVRDESDRQDAMDEFVADLANVAAWLRD
ncbi:MAG: UdgX family uracil-DNA binding protein [Solirubrobacteraceae bacterium]